MRRLVLLFAAPLVAGCASNLERLAGGVSRESLQARMMAFADTYRNQIDDAAEASDRESATLAEKVASASENIDAVSAVITIAADADPAGGLLDLAAVVSLQRMAWEEPWLEETVGPGAAHFRRSQRGLETQIWEIVDDILPEDRLKELKRLIARWRAEHPTERRVSGVRFDDVAAAKGEESTVKQLLGIFNVLAPIDRTAKAVEDTRLLGERALFLSQRLPSVMIRQTELVALRFVALEDIQKQLEATQAAAKAAERAAATVEKLPDTIAREREEAVKALEARSADARVVTADLKETMAKADEAMAKAQEIGKSGERMTASVKEMTTTLEGILGKTGEKTKIDELLEQVRKTTESVEKTANAIRDTIQTGGSTAESEGLRTGLRDLDVAVGKRLDATAASQKALIDHAYRRGLILIGAGALALLATLAAWRLISARLPRPGAGSV